MAEQATVHRLGRRRTCPICGRPATAASHRPFCSARCADIDLGRWLDGRYRIPSEEAPATDRLGDPYDGENPVPEDDTR